MTVSTTESVVFYDGTGSLAPWPVPFRFFDDTDLAVQKIDANGGSSPLVLGADYSVTGAGNLGGGTVTPTAPLLVGETAIIARVLSPVQETDLRNQGRFFAQIHEDVFDYLTMLIQQTQEGLSRALLRPLGRDYYDAEGRVIANLGDPANDRDAVNYRTLLRKLAELATDGSGQFVLEALALPSGSDLVGFSAEDFGQPTTTLLKRGRRIILPGDYYTQGAAIEAVKAGRTFLANPQQFTLSVGPGGQFSTLALAIAAACRMRPTQGQGLAQCVINLLTGFVLREQILVRDGSDLSWIKITAADAMVEIDPAYITQALSAPDDSYPAFGALGSTLPVIGCLFHYANNATARDGVAVMLGSSVRFEPGAGVVRARRGLLVFYGSEANCYPLGLTQGGDGTGAGTATGVDFSYAKMRALHVAYGSRANLGRSMLHHCDGDLAVYVIWGSHADLYQSNASYCINGTAFLCRDGSFLNCRESNGSHSKRAFHALHNGRINARSRLSGPTMIWIGDGAQFCTEYGVLASGNSHIEASELNAGSCTGSAGISASDGSTVSFINGSARNCSIRAVWAQFASNISCNGSDVSNSPNGLIAISGSSIGAANVIATGCTNIGALAASASVIDVDGGNLSGCMRGIEPREGSTINAREANLSSCTERAVSAIDGGTANVQGADCRNSGSRGITARNGARVAAVGANCSGAVNWAAEVLNGSTIAFNQGIAGASPLNVLPNTLTADGIIYQ
ncbi:hypothetical protein ACBQ21_09125 [Pseudomonas putida]|uniref:hypothetical protein n=1 Tax=Pseudomonas putida TaxID=303 RepID=UPI003523EF8F